MRRQQAIVELADMRIDHGRTNTNVESHLDRAMDNKQHRQIDKHAYTQTYLHRTYRQRGTHTRTICRLIIPLGFPHLCRLPVWCTESSDPIWTRKSELDDCISVGVFFLGGGCGIFAPASIRRAERSIVRHDALPERTASGARMANPLQPRRGSKAI